MTEPDRRLAVLRVAFAACVSAAVAASAAACGDNTTAPGASPSAAPSTKTADTAAKTASPMGSHGASPGSAAPAGSYPSTPASASGSPATSASPAGSADAGKDLDESWSKETKTTLDTAKGPIVLHAVFHGTVYLEVDKKVIWVDPYGEGGNLDGTPKADFVLITDIHGDHLDEKALGVVTTKDTVVLGSKAVADKHPGTQLIVNGEKKTVGPVEVEAIPMYNLKRGPADGKLFHDKGRGNGYVISYGGKRVYFSGDTECTPEMKALKDIDLAFVCMNLPYTMPPEEAAECINAFKPKTVVPYHHRGSDLSVLDKKVEKPTAVLKLKFY